MKEMVKSIGKFLWNVVAYIGNAIVWLIGLGIVVVVMALMALVFAPIGALVSIIKDGTPAREAFGEELDYIGEYLGMLADIIND